VTLTSVVTKTPHVVVRTGQNTGKAAQTAARWTSRHARPPVVELYQLGSNWNVLSWDRWMMKTIRRTAHEMVKRPRVKSPTRQSLVFLGVSGLKQSGIGIAKMVRSSRALLEAWLTKTRAYACGLREPNPQQ